MAETKGWFAMMFDWFTAAKELAVGAMNFIKAKWAHEAEPDVIRQRDLGQQQDARQKAVDAVSSGDTQEITLTAADVIKPGLTGTAPGFEEEKKTNAELIKEGDVKKIDDRLKGLLGILVIGLVLCGGCLTTPAPVVPVSWTVEKQVKPDGSVWYAAPDKVWANILDELAYLKTIREQGRIKSD